MQRSITEEVPSRLEIRRAKVAEAARGLFARHGFHATGIAQIAEASGIKVQQIYRDFTNKEAIVAAIVESDVGQLLIEIEQIGDRAGDREALKDWLKRMLLGVLCGSHPRLFTEIFAEASRNPRIATILQTIDLELRTALIAAFATFAARDADVGHLGLVADLFLTFVGGLNERPVAHPALDSTRLADMICGLIVDQIPL